MEPYGHLSVRWDKKGEHIDWDWHPSSPEALPNFHMRRDLTPGAFDLALEAFYTAWDTCSQYSSQGNGAATRALLMNARDLLQSRLLPEGLSDLASLGPPGALLTITVLPDAIPLEVFEANGKPFCMRYQLLHAKLDDRGYTTRSSQAYAPVVGVSNPSAGLYASATFTGDLLGGADARKTHASDILDSLRGFYGQNVNTCRDRSLSVAYMQKVFSQPTLACLYHFGHGITNNHAGGLRLADGILDAEQIALELARKQPKGAGLAFINACWSAATGTKRTRDVARVLLDSGWQAVLGTVLPPLDVQAAHAAYLFFDDIGKHLHIMTAFQHVRLSSWKRFWEEEHPDLSWASYRLYGSPHHLWLRTDLTHADGIVAMPGIPRAFIGKMKVPGQSVTYESSPEKTLDSVSVAHFWKTFAQDPHSDMLDMLQKACTAPDVEPVVRLILTRLVEDSAHPPARQVFAPDLRRIFEQAKHQLRQEGMGRLDLPTIQRVVFHLDGIESYTVNLPASDSRITPLLSIQVHEQLIDLLMSVLRTRGPTAAISLREFAQELEIGGPESVRRLFIGENGALTWDLLERSAKGVLFGAWHAARNDGSQIIELRHLLQGVHYFCMTLAAVVTDRGHKELHADMVEYVNREIEGFIATHQNFVLHIHDFTRESLWVLDYCSMSLHAKSRQGAHSGFWYACLDHLVELRDTVADSQDHYVFQQEFVRFQALQQFLEFRSIAPRVIRKIVRQPTRSPGVSPKATEAFDSAIQAVGTAWNIGIAPKSVPVFLTDEEFMLEAMLAELQNRWDRQGSPRRILWIPWDQFLYAQEPLSVRERLLNRLVGVSSPVRNLLDNLTQELHRQAGRLLLCVDNLDCLIEQEAWNASRPLLTLLTSPLIPAVVVATPKLLERRPYFRERPFVCVKLGKLHDEATKEMLFHHTRYWLNDDELEWDEAVLEAILKRARWSPDNRSLISIGANYIQRAIDHLNTLPHDAQPSISWEQILHVIDDG